MGFQFEPFNTSQVAVTGTATQVAAALASRQAIIVTNTSTTDVYVGNSSSVTTATGTLLPGTKGASLTIPTTSAVWAITSGGTQTVTVVEITK